VRVAEVHLEAGVDAELGVLRQLRRFEPSLTLAWVQDVMSGEYRNWVAKQYAA